VLENLDHNLLAQHSCYFAGGTAIAMRFGELRRSDDMDFMVAEDAKYRALRAKVRMDGPGVLFLSTSNIGLPQTFLSDQYGIRGWVEILGAKIKLEIVSEGRIEFETPGPQDAIGSIQSLTESDLVAEKLLANSDRFLDSSVFARDLIDLAFIGHPNLRNSKGFKKAVAAYSQTIENDLTRSVDKFLGDLNWANRCLEALDVEAPRALVFKLVEKLR
jgi:hypothetical protein